jgi:hypothetical protein
MDFNEFRQKVVFPVADRPQLVGLANFHLDNMHAAIAGLQNMGHRVEVGFAEAPAPLQFPKMLYHPDGTTLEVVNSAAEIAAKADGWAEHAGAGG